MDIMKTLSAELGISVERLTAAIALLDEGNTVPFIARYRKEVTGGMDDEQLRKMEDRLTFLRNLEKRREEVTGLIDQQGKLSDEVRAAIEQAKTVTELDDIYRPFRPKRKTRASVAKERGLEPLAQLIMEQRDDYSPTIEEAAAAYVDEEKGVPDADAAIAGAKDIIAEDVSDNAEFRKLLREMLTEAAEICTEAAAGDKANATYADYADYRERVKTIPPHRVLAINRGEAEEALKVHVEADANRYHGILYVRVATNRRSPACKYISEAVCDAYDRLIFPSLEREIRADLTETASEHALGVFSDNLKHLLMQAPLKGKTVLGYDPGYGHGCKLAVVDKTGMVVDTAVINPFPYPGKKVQAALDKGAGVVERMIRAYKVDVVAIGNGTASQESEMFIAELLTRMNSTTKYAIVSEAGASVYSASKVGAEEFPDYDVMQRSAVSIARRLQDPLAELVKIDPKSIGVGQYQHDMKESRLDECLTGVVEDCVNSVGVDINTASYMLLSYIAGINKTIAKNIVAYREKNGEFRTRTEILDVPRLGAKAYEQCAGFLRVPGGDEILDNTGVHPESYDAARYVLKLFGYSADDVRAGRLKDIRAKAKDYGMERLSSEAGCGEETMKDIIGELEKPGRDVRDSLPPPQLRDRVLELEDLKPGMMMKGTVRNVVDFGAFVDIGVHQDGLVHISHMSDTKRISSPSELVHVGDVIDVRVLNVDVARKRIALTMKKRERELDEN